MADETTAQYLERFRKKLKSGIPLRLANYLLELQLTDSDILDDGIKRKNFAKALGCSISSITNAITILEGAGIIEPLGAEKKNHAKELRLIRSSRLRKKKKPSPKPESMKERKARIICEGNRTKRSIKLSRNETS